MGKSRSDKQFNKKFGKFLKKKRLELKMTQVEVSDKIGNNFQNVSRLEAGEYGPTLFWCTKLAAAFDMELSELIREFEHSLKK